MKSSITLILAAAASAVLLQGFAASTDQTAADNRYNQATSDIVHTANQQGSFKVLLAAIDAADLQQVLHSPGPYTFFAPTDQAFAKLPPGAVAELLLPSNRDTLKDLLRYHIVPARLDSAQLVGKQIVVRSLQGSSLSLQATDNWLRVNDSDVTSANLEASNGLIHAVDSLLLPTI